MNKFKQCTYTFLLAATCFVASPFIFHKIWVTSSEANKTVTPPPTQASTSAPASDSTAAPSDDGQPSAAEPTAAAPENAPSDTAEPTAAAPENAPSDTAAPPAEETPSGVSFVKVEKSYFDDALFVGDSRTVGIEEYGDLKNADYFCSVGLAAGNINKENVNGKTFDQTIGGDKKYGKVYVMLGINEVGNDPEVTLTAYRAIVEKLKVHQSEAVIFIQGNLHVAASSETNVINNQNINYLNARLASLADNKQVFYIDINEVYDDEYGCLTSSYTSDGVHPYAKYYALWTDWLCSKAIDKNAVVYTEN